MSYTVCRTCSYSYDALTGCTNPGCASNPANVERWATLARCEDAVKRAEQRCKAASRALALLWDRIDAGEQISDEPARRRVRRANDADSAARSRWVAAWKACGSPMSAFQRRPSFTAV